jgi:hypothetical protein
MKRVATHLGCEVATIAEIRPVKISVDARSKHPVRVFTLDVWRDDQDVPVQPAYAPHRPVIMRQPKQTEMPLIVGAGPAGLWAALRFVQSGQPVVMLDRGPAVENRNRAVVGLRRHGVLKPEANLCFGEGGAGTYSDGKLYTRVKDHRVRRVYEDLVAFGSPESLLVDAHPHVGTNRLIKLVKRVRTFLLEAGCEIRFDTKVVDLLTDRSGRASGVRLSDGEELTAPATVLATGHSARALYGVLDKHGVGLARKPFAVGARVEHPQALVDEIQFGEFAGHKELGAAAYALTARVGPRGVYSFCMCPGGYVIPTPTEPNHLNVNGMSNSNRGSRWANSAWVVTLEPTDFWVERPGDLDHHGALAGIALQRHLESRAFEAGGGGYRAPGQRLTDFMASKPSADLGDSSYKPGLTPTDLRSILPQRVADAMARATVRFDERMKGFLSREATVIGVETTTSSPVRILRDPKTCEAQGLPGLYPCGEGGGHAGGIVSSAIDGIRVAESILGEGIEA